jgi:ParB family transcriptional regulator, chromosome partitioning protein
VQAKRYYTKDDDGLKQKWRGKVFLNPPYSDPTPFIDTFIKGYEVGVVSEAILLENTDASSRWFHRSMMVCSAMCFASTRIKFKSGVNGKEGAPRYSSLFFYFGSDVEKFARRFSTIGSICIPYRLKD